MDGTQAEVTPPDRIKTPFERWMGRVWRTFEGTLKSQANFNRLLFLADLAFREDLKPAYEQRLPEINPEELESIYASLDVSLPLGCHHVGIYIRLTSLDSISWVEDLAEALDDEQISPEAYVDMSLAFLTVAIANETFPIGMQLSEAELYLVRDSMIGERILTTQVAGIVERKFQIGWFGQAGLLRSLFKNPDVCWAREEQRMFYEEFILTFGVRRKVPLSDEVLGLIAAQLSPDSLDSAADALRLINYVQDQTGLRLVSLFFNPIYSQDTRQIVENEPSSNYPRLDELLPPLRWRAINPIFNQEPFNLQDFLFEETLERYVLRHLSSIFVILRAHGTTGLEPYAQNALDWLEETFDIHYTRVLPEIYRRAMIEVEPMGQLFQDIFNTHFKSLVVGRYETFQQEDFSNIPDELIAYLRTINLRDIAPGNYDFTGFVYDSVLHFPYPTPEHAFFIHRIN